MSATKRITPFESAPVEARTMAPAAKPVAVPDRAPMLRVQPLLRDTQTRRFVRVPTYAIGVHPEHREYPRASLKLPMRLRGVGGVPEDFPITLVTRDISSTGVFFLCPKQISLGTHIELEIVLVSRPMGRGNVVIVTMAHVRRMEPAAISYSNPGRACPLRIVECSYARKLR